MREGEGECLVEDPGGSPSPLGGDVETEWLCWCGLRFVFVREEPKRCWRCGRWPLPVRQEPVSDEERETWGFPK